MFDINLKGTFKLIQTLYEQNRNLQRLVLASTDASYPSTFPLYKPVDENHPQLPNQFYGMTKQISEIIGGYFHRELNMPVTTVRFCYTLAPKEIIEPNNSHSSPMFFLNSKIATLENSLNLDENENQTLNILKNIQIVIPKLYFGMINK